MNKRQRKKLVNKYGLDRISARTLEHTIRTFKLDVETTARAIDEVQRSMAVWANGAARVVAAFGLSIQQAAGALAPLADIVCRLPRWTPGLASAVDVWDEPDLPADHALVLVELARGGDAATFKDLAQSVGVPAEDLDVLWAGTLARLGLPFPRRFLPGY